MCNTKIGIRPPSCCTIGPSSSLWLFSLSPGFYQLNMASLIFKLMCIILLASLICASCAQSPDDLQNFANFERAFPGLKRIPNSIVSSQSTFYGFRWPDSLINICTKGSGWHAHGVHCSENGEIDTLAVYVLLNDFTSISRTSNSNLRQYALVQS